MASESSLRARTTLAIATAGCMIVLWAKFAPVDEDTVVYESETLKHTWRGCADVVIAGSSSASWAIDPSIVAKALPGRRVVNFGFESAALTPDYLEAVNRVLDAGSPVRVIVIAFDESLVSYGYWPEWVDDDAAAAELSQPVRVDRTWRERLEVALHPRGPCAMLFDACRHRYTAAIGAGGFLPHTFDPPDPARNGLFIEADVRRSPQNSTENLGPLFERIHAWREQGVVVTGFWVPVEASTLELAKQRGVSSSAIDEQFVAAGGIMLDIPRASATSDGEHMTLEAGRAVARQLGVKLAAVVPLGAAAANARPSCAWPVP
jgi:hypothetical protein